MYICLWLVLTFAYLYISLWNAQFSLMTAMYLWINSLSIFLSIYLSINLSINAFDFQIIFCQRSCNRRGRWQSDLLISWLTHRLTDWQTEWLTDWPTDSWTYRQGCWLIDNLSQHIRVLTYWRFRCLVCVHRNDYSSSDGHMYQTSSP